MPGLGRDFAAARDLSLFPRSFFSGPLSLILFSNRATASFHYHTRSKFGSKRQAKQFPRLAGSSSPSRVSHASLAREVKKLAKEPSRLRYTWPDETQTRENPNTPANVTRG